MPEPQAMAVALFRGGVLDGQRREVPQFGPAWVRYHDAAGCHWYGHKRGSVRTYNFVGTNGNPETLGSDVPEVGIEPEIPQREAAMLTIACLVGSASEHDLIEVRRRDPAHAGMAQTWFPVPEFKAAAEFALEHAAAGDVFVGALPRIREGGTRSDVADAAALWIDVDLDDGLERVQRFTPAPSIVLATGSVGHALAIWQLSEPLAASRVRAANRRLALAVGGDMAATDPARVIRIPGTFNHKHNPPALVEAVSIECHAYTAEQVVGELPDPEPAEPMRPVKATLSRAVDDVLATIPATEYIPLLTGRELGADNKINCPFHAGGQERTPSLHAYDEAELGFYCFGCEAGGSIYDFGSRLYGIEPRGPGFERLRRRLASELLERIEAA